MVSACRFRNPTRQILYNYNLTFLYCFSNDKSEDSKSKTDKNGKSKLKQPREVAEQILAEYPEEPTTCCMSGCANCVWLDYAEKISNYYRDGGERALKEINERVTDPNIKAFLLQELRIRQKFG